MISTIGLFVNLVLCPSLRECFPVDTPALRRPYSGLFCLSFRFLSRHKVQRYRFTLTRLNFNIYKEKHQKHHSLTFFYMLLFSLPSIPLS